MEGEEPGFEIRDELEERTDSDATFVCVMRGVVGLLDAGARKVAFTCCTTYNEKKNQLS